MSFAERPLEEWQPTVQTKPSTSEALKPALESMAADTPVENIANTAAIWGWFPVISIIQAGGLLLMSLANQGALAASSLSNVLYWLGLAVILLPVAVRLIATDAARQERVGLVISTGLILYLVKLIQSPFAFTYGDEFLHLFNTNQILQNQALFSANPVLPVSPLFPGLPSVTAAISTLTGLSVFQAGTIVIGLARLLLVTSLFLFAEQITRSARIAGLTALFFMCSSNFLYWSAQFAYESLSFPLIIGTFYLVARRERAARRSTYMAYTILSLLLVSAIVVTHHISSYFMVAFLFGWLILSRTQIHLYLGRSLHVVNEWRKGVLTTDEMITSFGSQSTEGTVPSTTSNPDTETDVNGTMQGPEGLALFSFILALAWLTYVAITTYGYLSGIFSRAGLSFLDVLAGSEQVRQLFAGDEGYVAPLAERIIAVAGVLLSLLALPFGLQHFWQRYRDNMVAWILAIGAVSYFAMLPLRLTAAGWQMGNRASVYFYLGLAFVLALAADKIWSQRQRFFRGPIRGSLLFGLIFSVIFASGAIAGWNPQNRLTKPLVVDAGGGELIETEGMSAALWMRETLGEKNKIVTDEANGRLMLAHGNQEGYIGRYVYVKDILQTPNFTPAQLTVMQDWELDYAVVDRREVAWDNMAGYFFNPVDAQGQTTAEWSDPAIYEKFDRQPLVSRVMDAGTIVIYDVAELVTTARRMVNGETIAPEVRQQLLAGSEAPVNDTQASTNPESTQQNQEETE